MKEINCVFSKIRDCVKKNYIICIILTVFAVVFGVKMFTNVLCDDEIGFYLSPTSRGVFFSFLMYETTGYHILYAGLSAIINKLGNIYLGIRGVSFIAWFLSNIVIYKIWRLKCENARRYNYLC